MTDVWRDSAGRRYQRDGDQVVYLDPLPVPAHYTNDNPDDPCVEPDDGLLGRIRNGSWLDAQHFPPLRYHLPGIVPEGSTLLVGPPKIGKSWFVLALGLAAASGGRALGQPVDARPVLYLALEDGDRRLQERCRMLLADDPIPEPFEYVTVVDAGRVLATIAAWLEAHPTPSPLVILDTLGRVMPPALMGESSYQRDYRIGAAIKRLADDHPGVGLLTNHHDRKAAAEDFVERVSGTNGLAGAADTIVVLARPRHESAGLLQVTGRDVPEGEYALTFDGPTGLWSLDGADLAASASRAGLRRATAGVGDRMAEVIEFVSENPGVGATAVAAELDIRDNSARTYLSRAVESGRLTRTGRGAYAPCGGVASVAVLRPEALNPEERNNATDATPLIGGPDRPSDDNRELFR